MKTRKVFAYSLILILIANMILFGLKKIPDLAFWVILAVIGAISYIWFRKK